MIRFRSRRHRSGRRRVGPSGRDRGATTVEYALVVALMVFGGMGAIETLNDGAASRDEREALAIEGLDDVGANSTTTTAPPATTTTTAPPATTTTTAPPATTTTTAPPATTTTTAPPQTTTTVGPSTYTTIASLVDVSVKTGGTWAAEVEIHLEDQAGSPVAGAYVAVRFVILQNGNTYGGNCTTDAAGQCAAEWEDRLSLHSPVEAEVNTVISDPDWDGALQSILLYKP